jgi:hypothetical protein
LKRKHSDTVAPSEFRLIRGIESAAAAFGAFFSEQIDGTFH